MADFQRLIEDQAAKEGFNDVGTHFEGMVGKGGGTAEIPPSADGPGSGPPPSFSVIVPVYGETQAFSRTMSNLIHQYYEGPVEIIVVTDGPDLPAYRVCQVAKDYIKKCKDRVALDVEGKPIREMTSAHINPFTTIRYCELDRHMGNGNIARQAGLIQAKHDWIVFLDNGCAIMEAALETVADAIKTLQCKLVLWDMLHMVDPVPYQSRASAIVEANKDKGLGYLIPGIAFACKREDATAVGWPNVRASDWAFCSRLWDRLFPLKEPARDADVVIVPFILTVAYAHLRSMKARFRGTPDDTLENREGLGFDEAQKELSGADAA